MRAAKAVVSMTPGETRHDRAPTGGYHAGQHLAVQAHRGQQACVEVSEPVGVGHGQRPVWDEGLAACVVDQDVDAAEVSGRLGRQLPRAIRGGEVGGNEVAGAVVVAAGPGGDNDPRAGAVEVPGDRGADAPRAAGDQGVLSL